MSSVTPCTHPPDRVYWWVAADRVLCAGCCVCGAVVAGDINAPGPHHVMGSSRAADTGRAKKRPSRAKKGTVTT